MQYTQGTIGRVFIIKFEDRDDLLGELKGLAQKENIR
ncbi:MAG TPA: DNA-binding protein, partial [Nitrospiraceae bacterium]|nr:DNA-binding protein [Nitrospiraceae bacterium]